MNQENRDDTAPRTVTRQAHWVEWLTGSLCAALVTIMIGWIAYHAIVDTGGAPELSVRPVATQPTSSGYRIAFVVENSGPRTATSVPVIGELKDGERMIESRDVKFDYVPALSMATGALLFRTNPEGHTLELHAAGYVDP